MFFSEPEKTPRIGSKTQSQICDSTHSKRLIPIEALKNPAISLKIITFAAAFMPPVVFPIFNKKSNLPGA